MREKTFRTLLARQAPEVPEIFSNRMEKALERIVEEANMKETTRQTLRTGGRISRRALTLALALMLALGAAAVAATQWHVFDVFSYMTGKSPVNADQVMQRDLHMETVNGVEIRIRECGYDGRQLFLEYSYTFPDMDRVLTCDDDLYAMQDEYGVGWWSDSLWFNGVGMDMPGSSGGEERPGDAPGELIVSQNWRLDNTRVTISGPTEIILPIGKPIEDREYYVRAKHPEHWDENGERTAPPEGCGVRFTFDPGDAAKHVTVTAPNVPTVFPDVTIKVSQVVYSPLMTYITLDMTPNADMIATYKAVHGEGYCDENGELLWAYSGADVYGDWVSRMALVDGSGNMLFPENNGLLGYGESWAEFDYPFIEHMPEELYMAAVSDDGAVDMTRTVKVK